VGKTALALTAARQAAEQFDFAIWITLNDAPALSTLSDQIAAQVSRATDESTAVTDEAAPADAIMRYLRRTRPLVILDNWNSLQTEADPVGYLHDRSDFGRLLDQLISTRHRSCVIITSREDPVSRAFQDTPGAPITRIRVPGLSRAAGAALLRSFRLLRGSKATFEALASRYSGNPLALRLLVGDVAEVFNGSVDDYMRSGAPVPATIAGLVLAQTERCDEREHDILRWLTCERVPLTALALAQRTATDFGVSATYDSLRRLRSRSLIEQSEQTFFLQAFVAECLLSRLIDDLLRELQRGEPGILNRVALLSPHAPEDTVGAQIRLLLDPLVDRFTRAVRREQVSMRLHALLRRARDGAAEVSRELNYAIGNLLNLAMHADAHLAGLGLSHTAMRRARFLAHRAQQIDMRGLRVLRVLIQRQLRFGHRDGIEP
jgi:hypothetical protein